MADPFTWAMIGAATAAMGAAVSAVGAIQTGKAQKSAAEYNAAIAEQDRERGMRASSIAAEDKRRRNMRLLASQRAMLGTSGLDLAGSPLEALQDSATEMAIDERRIEAEGGVESREGFVRVQTYKAEGEAASAASYYSAGGSLLKGASSASSGMYTVMKG